MPEIFITENIRSWGDAIKAVRNHEIPGAIFNICDPQTATNSIIDSRFTDEAVDSSLLPGVFTEVVSLTHKYSNQKTNRVDPKTKYPVYRTGGTGLHVDNNAFNGAPLNMNFVAHGQAEVLLLPIELTPEANYDGITPRIADMLVDEPGFELPEDLKIMGGADKFLPRSTTTDLGAKAIIGSGQLIAFAGYRPLNPENRATAHQFISLGQTIEERNSRASAVVRTDILFPQ